jgi:hypothetical protein
VSVDSASAVTGAIVFSGAMRGGGQQAASSTGVCRGAGPNASTILRWNSRFESRECQRRAGWLEFDQRSRLSAVQTPRQVRRVRSPAQATQEHGSAPLARFEIVIVSGTFVSAYELIDENQPFAALRLLERFPAGAVACGTPPPVARLVNVKSFRNATK